MLLSNKLKRKESTPHFFPVTLENNTPEKSEGLEMKLLSIKLEMKQRKAFFFLKKTTILIG